MRPFLIFRPRQASSAQSTAGWAGETVYRRSRPKAHPGIPVAAISPNCSFSQPRRTPLCSFPSRTGYVSTWPPGVLSPFAPVSRNLLHESQLIRRLMLYQGAATNFAGLLTCRILLGVFEATVLPSFVLITQMWYTRRENSYRTIAYQISNGIAGMIGTRAT
jgi:MFS family permease